MKVKILLSKCGIKEGVSEKTGKPYKFTSADLFVVCEDFSLYEKVCKTFKGKGCSDDQIAKFSTPKEYEGKKTFAFWLKCSKFTFDNVQKFGVLDAKISFNVNSSNYAEAKIFVENGKEQVNGYVASENDVTGWNIPTPTSNAANTQPVDLTVKVSDDPFYNKPIVNNLADVIPAAITEDDPAKDLPF